MKIESVVAMNTHTLPRKLSKHKGGKVLFALFGLLMLGLSGQAKAQTLLQDNHSFAFTIGTAIANVGLPNMASNADGDFTIASYLTGDLSTLTSAGITFSTTTGTFTGNPTAAVDVTYSTLLAQGSVNTQRKTFNMRVLVTQDAVDLIADTHDFTFHIGTAIGNIGLPNKAPEGSGFYDVGSFTIGDLSALTAAGIAFNTTTGTFTGNPTAIVNATYGVVAHGPTSVQRKTFNMRVLVISSNPVFTTQQPNIDFTAGFARTIALGAATGGTTAYTYTLTRMGGGNVPNALQLDSTNAELTASALIDKSHAGNYILTVRDANGNTASTTFAITVADRLSFSGTQPRVHFIVGTAGTAQLITASGGAGTLAYSLSRQDAASVQSALTINSTTALLSATNSATADTAAYVLTATDDNGATATANFEIAVSDVLTPLPLIASISFTLGTQSVVTLVAATGGYGTLSYFLSRSNDAVPAYLSINARTRALSYNGANNAASSVAISFNVTDQSPTPQVQGNTLLIAILSPPSFAAGDIAALTAGYTVRVSTAIPANVTLPDTTASGAIPFTYKLTTGTSSNYADAAFAANGIAFDASTRTLSGNPTAAATHRLRYHVRDKNGATTSQATAINVVTALALTQANIDVGVGETGVDRELTAPTNAIGTVTYTLTDIDESGLDDLPGINYTAATNKLSGTVTGAAATFSFIYTAHDTFDDATAVTTFEIRVTPKPTFPGGDITATYTRNHPIYSTGVSVSTSGDDLTLPAAPSAAARRLMPNSTTVCRAG